MKATDLLEKQHRKVEGVLKKLEGGRSDAKPLLRELANDLVAHLTIEQEIFYPAAKEADEDLVLESYEEHSVAEVALMRLLATDLENESFRARVKVLKDLIEHHVREEEEYLFPEVKKAIDGDKLTELGKTMKTRFDEVVDAGFESAVLAGFDMTSADMATRAAGKRKSDGDWIEREGGYSKAHGYGVGHGGPTGPDDAPAVPSSKVRNTPSSNPGAHH
jgi:hemerythrin-like domain-containing protein